MIDDKFLMVLEDLVTSFLEAVGTAVGLKSFKDEDLVSLGGWEESEDLAAIRLAPRKILSLEQEQSIYKTR